MLQILLCNFILVLFRYVLIIFVYFKTINLLKLMLMKTLCKKLMYVLKQNAGIFVYNKKLAAGTYIIKVGNNYTQKITIN